MITFHKKLTKNVRIGLRIISDPELTRAFLKLISPTSEQQQSIKQIKQAQAWCLDVKLL